MDTSGDGTLDKKELIDFLMKKVKEQQPNFDAEMLRDQFNNLADDMFSKIDQDSNGKIYLNEFVDFYYLEQRRLMESIEETKLRISDSKTRADQI